MYLYFRFGWDFSWIGSFLIGDPSLSCTDLVGTYSLLPKNKNHIMNLQYSCNKITNTWIQISRQIWNGLFSSISHQRMIKLTPICSFYIKNQAVWTLTKIRNWLWIHNCRCTNQILTNDDQMVIWCISYFITRGHILITLKSNH